MLPSSYQFCSLEQLYCTVLPERVQAVPGREISVQVQLQGRPFPSESDISAVHPWSITKHQNESYTVVRSGHKGIGENHQEEVLRAHHTVAGANNYSGNASCSVEIGSTNSGIAWTSFLLSTP